MQIFDISKKILNTINNDSCISNENKYTRIVSSTEFILEDELQNASLLSKSIGLSQVISLEGNLGAKEISELFEKADCGIYHNNANEQVSDSFSRILIKGNVTIDEKGAQALVEYGVECVGIETDYLSENKKILEILFSRNILVIENLSLSAIQDGMYLLNTSPLPLKNSTVSFCRAVLIL